MTDRVESFLAQADYARLKADKARSEEMRRSWLILAHDWTVMAEKEREKLKAAIKQTTPDVLQD